MSDRLEQMKGNNWYFTLSLTTRSGITLLASRSPDTPSEIHVAGAVIASGLVEQKDLADNDTATVGTRKWTNWLGQECFLRDGMPAVPPTFRSLIRHLVRIRTDSLIDPFRTLANQGAEAVQTENAYLLNLDRRFAKEWAKLRDRKARVALADDSHRHSGIAHFTPDQVQDGSWNTVWEKRQDTLAKYYAQHPERFAKPPTTPAPAEVVGINHREIDTLAA